MCNLFYIPVKSFWNRVLLGSSFPHLLVLLACDTFYPQMNQSQWLSALTTCSYLTIHFIKGLSFYQVLVLFLIGKVIAGFESWLTRSLQITESDTLKVIKALKIQHTRSLRVEKLPDQYHHYLVVPKLCIFLLQFLKVK